MTSNVVQETDGQTEEDLLAIVKQQQAASEQRERHLALQRHHQHNHQQQQQQQQRQQERRLNRHSGHVPRPPATHAAARAQHRESIGNTRYTNNMNTDDPFYQPIVHPYQGVSSMVTMDCTWRPMDEPLTNGTPPEGMRPTSIRKYFTTMRSNEHETLSVGEFVELVPGPGGSQPKVAQVLALWKQVGRPKESCLYGRFLRYYRFDETSLNRIGLKSQDNQNRVYKTAHVEENVPLAAVLNKCYVEVMSGLDAPTEHQTQQMSDKDALLCSATYDFETGALAPIE